MYIIVNTLTPTNSSTCFKTTEIKIGCVIFINCMHYICFCTAIVAILLSTCLSLENVLNCTIFSGMK